MLPVTKNIFKIHLRNSYVCFAKSVFSYAEKIWALHIEQALFCYSFNISSVLFLYISFKKINDEGIFVRTIYFESFFKNLRLSSTILFNLSKQWYPWKILYPIYANAGLGKCKFFRIFSELISKKTCIQSKKQTFFFVGKRNMMKTNLNPNPHEWYWIDKQDNK